MKTLTTNQTAILNELRDGYELSYLMDLAKRLGLKPDVLKGTAKRLSVALAADGIARLAAPKSVVAALDDMGFETNHIIIDDFETTDARGEYSSAEEVEAESESEADESEADESEANEESAYETGVKVEFDPDEFGEYFGRGQTKILKKLHQHHESKSGAPSASFELRTPEGGVREVDGIAPACFQRVLDLAMARKPIMLVGPTGCGKTHIASMVAKAINARTFGSVSCTEGMSENQLTGWLLPIGDGGKFVYVPASFVDCYENGGVFLKDELDASDANALLVTNSAVANDFLHLPHRYENPVVKKHPDFVLIAAANTYGNGADMQFVGRNQLDEATLDRFRCGMITMDYDPKVEESICSKDVLAWGRKMRDKVKTSNLKKSVSTRFLRDLSDMYSVDKKTYGQAFWEGQLFTGWSRDEISRVA